MSTNFRIVRMTSEHVPGAVTVLREAFFTNEKVCNCVRILDDSEEVPNETGYRTTVAAKELEDLAVDTVKDGVSFVAVDVNTNQVLGVAFNKIQVKPPPGELSYFEKFARDHIRQHSALELVDFMVNVDGRYDLFGSYETECLLEIMFLAVRTDAKGRGIGSGLVGSSARLAQEMKWRNEGSDPGIDVRGPAKELRESPALGSVPKCVSAIFTSRFSQKCGQRCGFDEVLRVPYTEFTYKGVTYDKVTGADHPYCTLSVKRLE